MTHSARLSLPALALMLIACPVLADDSKLIIPGKSVGPIKAGTSEADLADQLPPGQVKRVLYGLGEGAAGCGTEVFSGTQDVVVVGWSSETEEYQLDHVADLAKCLAKQALVGPVSVMIGNPGARWHTADGIKLGMTVSDLARLIGQAVSVSVCPCDFGGFVETPEKTFSGRIEVWAEYPLNSDYAYAAVIDTAADYMLSSADIDADAEGGFPIYRMIVQIGD